MSALDSLLVLDGIKGESQDQAYPGAIQLLAFEFGGSAAGADNPAAGRVRMQDVVVAKRVDAASMGLWTAMVGRKAIRTAKLILRRASGDGTTATAQTPYLEVTLSDVYVTAITEKESESTAADAIGFVKETVSLNFSKIDMTYSQLSDRGVKGVQGNFSYAIPRS